MSSKAKGGLYVSTKRGSFNILEPEARFIDLVAMVEAADNINRFGGQGVGSVSVLRHSLHVAYKGQTRDERVHGLLHDMHEVFTGEMTNPAKTAIRSLCKGFDPMAVIQNGLDAAIFKAAGWTPTVASSDFVKRADVLALIVEKTFLRLDPGNDWGTGLTDVEKHMGDFWAVHCLTHNQAVDAALAILSDASHGICIKCQERVPDGQMSAVMSSYCDTCAMEVK